VDRQIYAIVAKITERHVGEISEIDSSVSGVKVIEARHQPF